MKLSPKQKKIAAKAPPRNKIDGKDFAVLKAEKAKGRGMGLQDEKMKPGKIMRAQIGGMGKATNYKKYLSALKEATKKPKIRAVLDPAARVIKATKYGKIAAGVAGAALLAKTGLEKLYEKRTGKRPLTKFPKKKMGGGMMKKPIKASLGLLAGSGVKKAANIIDEKREQGIQKKVDRDAMINKARKAIQGKNKNRITERDLQTVSNIIIKNKDRLTDRELKTAQDIIKTIPRTMPKVKIRERDIGIQKIKELIKNRPRNKMGGGMMMRPTPKLSVPQMSKGSSVTVKVKLGRNKPTKLL